MTSILHKMKSFKESESGSTAIMFGLLFTTVMGGVGFAVDYERAQNEKKIVQDHLDATLMHLGRSEDRIEPQEPGTSFLLDSLAEASINTDNLNPTFTYEPVSGTVTGTVGITPTTIISGGILPEIEMQVTSTASPRVVGTVEIALVLDNSGSMNFGIEGNSDTYVSAPNRRADSLQVAVDGMFDVIYDNPQVTPAVSVIPYASSVDITDVFVQNPISSFEAANGWTMEGLGIDDLQEEDVTYQDRSEGKGVWATERFISQRGNGSYNENLAGPHRRAIPVLSQGEMQTWCHDNYSYWYGSRCIKVAKGPDNRWHLGGYFNPKNGFLTMTTDSEAVRNYVASFEPTGGTAGHIGAAWGLYTLVPWWNDFFGHASGRPQNFEEATEKYLVIMTDGEFNSTHDSSMSGDDVFDYFTSICTRARSKDITVFTVGLKVEEGTKTDVSLTECAGDSGRYYPVGDHESLKEAFKKIGRETGVLRISS